jgi:hypothetical protein
MGEQYYKTPQAYPQKGSANHSLAISASRSLLSETVCVDECNFKMERSVRSGAMEDRKSTFDMISTLFVPRKIAMTDEALFFT